MTRAKPLIVGLFLVCGSLAGFTGSARAEPVESIRWLAAGDSFAAGEGLPEVEDETCQRATGRTGEGAGQANIAWAPKALELLAAKDTRFAPDRFNFVACTGNKSWQFARSDTYKLAAEWLNGDVEAADPKNQLYEVLGGRTDRFDLLTFSFGGNDIGFASIIYDCIGVGPEDLNGSGLMATVNPSAAVLNQLYRVGCDITAAELDRRLVALQQTLASLYDNMVSKVLTPGGRAVVMGYPQVIEEGGLWALRYGTRCNRIKRTDTPLLRTAAARLNQTIGQAVIEANKRAKRDVFTFIDVAATFEKTDNGNDRHALCGAGEDWLNGLVTGRSGDGFRLQRSFHPNQFAHDAQAQLLVQHLSQTKNLPTPPPTTTTAPPVSVPSACRKEDPVVGRPGVFEFAARCLYSAWRAGDRTTASRFAEPSAVKAIFGRKPGTAWVLDECYQSSGRTDTYLGYLCSFTEPRPRESHALRIIFTFVAYDDVVLVAELDFVG